MASSSGRLAWALGLAAALVAGAAAQQAAPRIAPRDQLKVTVFGFDTMSGEFQVDPDGTIKFPPIGLIKASGMTPREVEAAIAAALVSGGFAIRPPQVTVAVQPTASRSVTVTGEVKTPGTFSYAGEMTLYQALVKAGMPTATASDEVLIIHDLTNAPPTGGMGTAASDPPDDVETRSIRELEGGNRVDDPVLRDGDRVFVKKAGQVFIGGFVHNPNAYTIDSAGITLQQALTLAGGVTERGSENRVEILRRVPGKEPEKLKKVDKNTIVKPGDTVTVKARIF
ncbi:MAG TPA: polysaccharide biosynthesis/export family protein [Vicinamibacterales bacterium]|nr:polysaccharide biosynthesis/export family protein [Vicinamibacterales bacterium]